MSKIICIGECSLNAVFDSTGAPVGSVAGGRIVQAAAILSRHGHEVVMASDTGADAVGSIIVDYLSKTGVDIHCVDRYTDGRTALNIMMLPTSTDSSTLPALTRYEKYPEEAFDIIWPRIDPGDIVIYGGHYVIDRRMRERVGKLLAHACERKAVMIYLPGFLPEQEARITRVMPEILENMEMAHLIVTRSKDLAHIFGSADATEAFTKHISFYCRAMINIDAAAGDITFFSDRHQTTAGIPAEARTMVWNAGALAGIAQAVALGTFTPEQLDSADETLRQTVLLSAIEMAHYAEDTISNIIDTQPAQGALSAAHISSYIL